MRDDAEIRALYQEPLERFTATRDELAQRLRSTGHVERAALVKKLRKPSVPAWALDQLAKRKPEGIRALIDAGAEVRAAQQAALTSDRAADRLLEASADRRRAVTTLAGLAANVLLEIGRAPNQHMPALRSTLEAASIDPDAAERLLSGTLEREIKEPAGFGDVLGLRSVPSSSEESSKEPAQGGRRAGDDTRQAELGRLRRKLAAAGKKARLARQAADRMRDQLATQQSRLEELRERHGAAEAGALEAELELKRAEDAARRARS